MKYLVIGLGNLGRAIAENLARIGHEVIGVDKDMHRIDLIKNNISGSVCLDATDKEAINSLPLEEMDAIFITYGKDFGISVQTVALLKSMNANNLIVRSISPLHETVIKSIGVSEIMSPEEDFAAVYATHSILGALFKEWYRITDTHHIYKMLVPKILIGQNIHKINFEQTFNVRLVGVERATETKNLLGMKQTSYTVIDIFDEHFSFQENDIMIIFGKLEVMKKLANL